MLVSVTSSEDTGLSCAERILISFKISKSVVRILLKMVELFLKLLRWNKGKIKTKREFFNFNPCHETSPKSRTRMRY